MIEKEPVTVILSKRGWIRAQRGHIAPDQWGEFKFKEGDSCCSPHIRHRQAADRRERRAFLHHRRRQAARRARHSEPLRLMVDIDPDAKIVAMVTASADGRLLLASSSGHGFIAQMADVVAETRKGRNVVNLKAGAQLAVVRPISASDDSIAAVGENRKLVVFPISEVPVMARGQGVMLQRYRDGGLSDAVSFAFADGLSWAMGGDSGRTRTKMISRHGVARVLRAGCRPPVSRAAIVSADRIFCCRK